MAVVIQENVPLATYTTFKLGGSARYFITAVNEADIEAAVAFAQAKQLPLLVLGGGSNMLVSDTGYAGVVLAVRLQGVTYDTVLDTEVSVTAAAGEVFDDIVAATVAKGLWGLENLSAIPGSVGATPVQNVGAYGVEVADTIVRVRVYNTRQKRFLMLDTAQCAFGYRDSVFKQSAGRHLIVTAVTFMLSTTPQPQLSYADLASVSQGEQTPTLAAIRTAVCDIRRAKFPDWSVVGTAGSFFKNPIITSEHAQTLRKQYPSLPIYPAYEGYCKVSLGFILDKVCGLRGYRHGAVSLYENQALVLVAHTGATATEVQRFADEVAHNVFEKTKITIEREVNYF